MIIQMAKEKARVKGKTDIVKIEVTTEMCYKILCFLMFGI
jgi:hypothetical protein